MPVGQEVVSKTARSEFDPRIAHLNYRKVWLSHVIGLLLFLR